MILIQLWILCLVLTLLDRLVDQVQAMSTQPSRLSRIDTIENPTITFLSTHNRQKRGVSNTIFHDESFLLEFLAFDKPISLHLSPNVDLFHPDAELTIFNTDGSPQSVEKVEPSEYSIFQGYVNDLQHQWARIIIRNDFEHTFPIFEGAFSIDSDIYHIKTTTNYHLSKRSDDPTAPPTHMIIYRDSDQWDDDLHMISKRDHHHKSGFSDIMCAMEELAYNRRMAGSHAAPLSHSNSTFDSLWEKREDPAYRMLNILSNAASPTFSSSSTSTQGCPTARKIAYMGAAADCSYVLSYGSTRYAKLQMINDWNVASAVYERTFNVSLGLIYLQISVPECPAKPKQSIAWNQPCTSYYSINDRLSDFSLWRGKKGDDGAALWHLMTRCASGVKVGIAWLSQLCETQVSQQIEDDGSYEWVSGTGVSSITRDEWKVVAHEIGHGFGAIHDCTPQMCPCKGECGCCPLSDTVCSAGDTYLMNPTSNVSTNDFSPCSVSDICNTFPNIGYCLKTPDLRTGGSFSLCGNGILEPGEECDSGLTDSDCCYARTCKLKPKAVCDDYSNQCCLNCQIAPKDTVCRPAVSECDTAEYCTGESSQCPADLYDSDGSDCANGTMKCASGICTSRDQQCMARGLRQNISEQCSFQKDSCLISCTDPKDPRNCLMLSGMFLDGTECGLAGYCEKGACISTGALNTLKAWTDQNKAIAIPVFIFGSIGVLMIIGWIVWYFRRRHRRKILLAEKEKDSRPPSLNSYTEGGGHHNNGAIMLTSLRRDSQIVPFPNNYNSNANHSNDHNRTPNILIAPIAATNTIISNHSSNLDDMVVSTATNDMDLVDNNVHNNNNSKNDESVYSASSSSRNNPFFANNINGVDNTTSYTGTHRRGKSNVS